MMNMWRQPFCYHLKIDNVVRNGLNKRIPGFCLGEGNFPEFHFWPFDNIDKEWLLFYFSVLKWIQEEYNLIGKNMCSCGKICTNC